MDEATLRDCITRAYYVSEYYNHMIESIEVSDEEAAAHRDENLANYTVADIRANTYTYTSSDDASMAEALAKAQQHVTEGVTAEAFEEAAHKMLDASEQEENAEKDLTLKEDVNINGYSTEIQEWLLSDERVEGDVAYFDQGSSYIAIYFINTELLDYNVRDFSYIYVPAETVEDNEETEEDESEVTDEQLAVALATAEAILDEFLAGEQTKEAFATLAEAKVAENTNLYNGEVEEMTNQGSYVEIEEWLFAEDRQVGDVDTVETDAGYYIVYYTEMGDEYWKASSVAEVTAEKYDTWFAEAEASYAVSYNEQSIDKVVY